MQDPKFQTPESMLADIERRFGDVNVLTPAHIAELRGMSQTQARFLMHSKGFPLQERVPGDSWRLKVHPGDYVAWCFGARVEKKKRL